MDSSPVGDANEIHSPLLEKRVGDLNPFSIFLLIFNSDQNVIFLVLQLSSFLLSLMAFSGLILNLFHVFCKFTMSVCSLLCGSEYLFIVSAKVCEKLHFLCLIHTCMETHQEVKNISFRKILHMFVTDDP